VSHHTWLLSLQLLPWLSIYIYLPPLSPLSDNIGAHIPKN
jgi:hypothetical protein